jgi:hypothetical protein
MLLSALVVTFVWGLTVPAHAGAGIEDDILWKKPKCKIKVRVVRTPGVGDFSGRREFKLDGARLSPEENLRLLLLIAEADFFKLRSSPLPPPHIPDPPAGYEVTVSLDGRQHTIWVVDRDVTRSLRRLIDEVCA